MNEDLLREMIEKLKMDNSMQTETIKEKLKELLKRAYDFGYDAGYRDGYCTVEEICKCGHHTNDHSHPYPINLDNNDLKCDKCECKKFMPCVEDVA